MEDAATGVVHLDSLAGPVPRERIDEAMAAAKVLGTLIRDEFPWAPGAQPLTVDPLALLLARTWRPQLTVTGADGLPSIAQAGNVLRPYTAVKLSMRIPPMGNPSAALAALKHKLERNPPPGASVTFTPGGAHSGWNAPALAPWLATSVGAASENFFGQPFLSMGVGGTIPFMQMLGDKFPKAQFVITGVLGPGSNAHGPNEFLHLPTAERVTACVAEIIADHACRE